MEVIEILREATKLVYDNVKDLAGTPDAAGDYGRGAGGDISRKIDIVAEKTVLDYLKKINFNCTVLGEECGRVEISDNPKGYLIMDAIDGSANAVHGVPYFCCSLAFATEEKLSSVTDAVVTNLSNGQTYWSSNGKGAYLDGKPIHVQGKNPTYRIVGINTSGASMNLLKKLQPVFENHNHTRHFGANALEMAMLASGLLDIYIDFRGKIRIQDLAAGYHIIREAGGLILDEELKPLESDFSYETRLSFIAASNQEVLNDIISQMN